MLVEDAAAGAPARSREDRVRTVLEAIDAANAADPTIEDGEPAALLYGRRMTDALAEFEPEASEHLRIACRGQHVERWTRPRRDWPDGRAGYLQWRENLKRFHAERVSGMMVAAGWAQADRERVASLIRKERLKRDPEAQALEDVACLVFIRWHLTAFAAQHDAGKVQDIVAKTARKMSSRGRAAALRLELPDGLAAVISAA